jgi:hypothetical protein
MFGPHRCVEAAKTQAATTCLDDFWGGSREERGGSALSVFSVCIPMLRGVA